jgi:ABC-type Fe3+-siderophore transport system permease subunit
MANAILIMSDNSFLAITSKQPERVMSHWLLQVCGLILIIAGHICIFVLKTQNNLPRFKSIHSLIGLAAFIFSLITGFQGVFTRYSVQLRKIVKPVVQKLIHSLIGNVAFILGVVSIIYGFNQIWNRDYDEVVKPILIALLSVSTVYVLYKSLITMALRVKQLFE